VEIAEPFTVGDVTLAALDVLDVSGIDQRHGEAARFEDFEDRDPVDAGFTLRIHLREQECG